MITINGIEFTDDPPAQPGAYLWTTHGGRLIAERVELLTNSKQLVVFADDGYSTLDEIGGLWSRRLVPVDELEKAWEEGYDAGRKCGSEAGDWNTSRAKRVLEGRK